MKSRYHEGSVEIRGIFEDEKSLHRVSELLAFWVEATARGVPGNLCVVACAGTHIYWRNRTLESRSRRSTELTLMKSRLDQ